jgi:two-component system sensor histidine kinase BarA
MQIEQNSIDFREQIDEVMTLLGPIAMEKNLELVNLVYEDVPQGITGDAIRIKQVLTNLISNAIKFTESGSIIVRIMLSDKAEKNNHGKTNNNENGEFLKIIVSDTGPGLTEDQQRKLFKSFSQADTSTTRKFGGTGLGLAISKKLVATMGGEIGIDSSHGNGADFWFTLPANPAQLKNKFTTPDNWSGREVFLLEPHKTLSLSLMHSFKFWGFKVHTYTNFEPLLKDLSELEINSNEVGNENPPIIVVSTSSKDTCFEKVAVWVKNNPQLIASTIVFTKNMSLLEQKQISAQGVDSVLQKPISRKTLLNSLEKILPRKHQVQTPPVVEKTFQNISHLKILIADDNPSNLKLIAAILEENGICADLSIDGQEAYQLARKNKYDLILMDIQMPKLDGIESAGLIRENSLNTKTPIIAVTAHAMKGEQDIITNSGMNGYLSKPINEENLQQIILQWCLLQQPNIKNSKIQSLQISEKNNKSKLDFIDWQLCLELANGKSDLAEDFYNNAINSIDEVSEKSTTYFNQKNIQFLLKTIHKFHGSVCYTGLPILKQATFEFETQLKKNGLDKSEMIFENFINQLQNTKTASEIFNIPGLKNI